MIPDPGPWGAAIAGAVALAGVLLAQDIMPEYARDGRGVPDEARPVLERYSRLLEVLARPLAFAVGLLLAVRILSAL